MPHKEHTKRKEYWKPKQVINCNKLCIQEETQSFGLFEDKLSSGKLCNGAKEITQTRDLGIYVQIKNIKKPSLLEEGSLHITCGHQSLLKAMLLITLLKVILLFFKTFGDDILWFANRWNFLSWIASSFVCLGEVVVATAL